MKIIGKTYEGFILEASKNEVAKLENYRNSSDNGYQGNEIGDTIDIAKLYTRIVAIENLNKNRLKVVLNEVSSTLDILKTANDLFADIVTSGSKDDSSTNVTK